MNAIFKMVSTFGLERSVLIVDFFVQPGNQPVTVVFESVADAINFYSEFAHATFNTRVEMLKPYFDMANGIEKDVSGDV